MALALLLAVAPAATALAGSDADAARLEAGIRLFRSLLAADLGVERRVDGEGRLLVLVFHAGDADVAARVARQLGAGAQGQAAGAIHGIPLQVELTSDPDFSAYQVHVPLAVFVAEPPRDEVLRSLVRFGIDHGVVVYSPFEGHVEKGVLGGLSVEATVQPYLNTATLEASHVELKPFFLKVSKMTR